MFVVFPRIRTRVSLFALPSAFIMLWLEGMEAFFVLVLSALLHEAGHLIAMKSRGYLVRRIDILPMGAVIVCPEGIPDRDETVIAISGPLASVVCAVISFFLYSSVGSAVSLYAVAINLVLGMFNLLPIKKLDGGKALYCFISEKTDKKETAERFCSAVSAVTKLLFVSVSVICIISSGFNLGVTVLALALAIQLLTD